MNGQKNLMIASAGVAGAIFTGTVSAATIYTDRISWEAAMVGIGSDLLVVDTFDQPIPDAPFITFKSGVESRGHNGVGNNDVRQGAYGGNVDSDKDGLDFDQNSDVFESITWRFPAPINGFGADFIEAATGEVLLLSGNFNGTGPQTIDFQDVLGNPGTGFLGLVSPVPFQEITFRSRTGDASQRFNEYWLIDNLSFGSPKPKVQSSEPDSEPEAIPEPFSAFAILAFGATAVRALLKQQSSS